ncbi:MAG: divergent polysaccharide deacetylase family protein [Candidatus Eremiobacteraeota bacterium]|nr:divergent polysaccharide deacetylase family protein [Candidatus Eremiobacteraeota bacterium]
MRTTAISLTVIALALAAILGGYASGQAGAHPPQIVVLHPVASPSVHAVAHGYSDSPIVDLFSSDDVVIDRAQTATSAWFPERLSLVIGLCGDSAALEGEFLKLGLPLAIDLDPRGAEAERVARYVNAQGLALLIHAGSPPAPSTLAELSKRFGHIDGIASRSSSGMASALRGTGLLYFDERGDADAHPFLVNGVRFIARDATVDDRSSPSYISFMLGRAAMRSEREGRMVVLMRPMPNSLAALTNFLGTRSAEIVALTQPR